MIMSLLMQDFWKLQSDCQSQDPNNYVEGQAGHAAGVKGILVCYPKPTHHLLKHSPIIWWLSIQETSDWNSISIHQFCIEVYCLLLDFQIFVLASWWDGAWSRPPRNCVSKCTVIGLIQTHLNQHVHLNMHWLYIIIKLVIESLISKLNSRNY